MKIVTDESSGEARSSGINRRMFMLGAASLTALASAGTAMQALAARPRTVIRNPLNIPPFASPSALALDAAPAVASLGGGKTTPVWAFNGAFPGPTLRANAGDSVNVTFGNGLAQESTIHWHGMLVPTWADGQPQDAIAPGGTYLYQYLVNQRAALNWYHPHPHMLTGEQVALGLAGGFIVNDAEELALGLPGGAYEMPLIIRDANFDRGGKLIYNPKSFGYLGSVPLVNGTRDPYLDVDTAIYRLRVLNGANARVTRLALSTGAPFTIVGNDGGLLASAASAGNIEFGPGERLDLLVDFRALPVGTRVMLRDLNAGWDLLEFRVARAVSLGDTLPGGALSVIEPLSAPVTTRAFSFDGMSRINGLQYDMERIDFQVPFGQVERWRFSTNGNAPHPVHVHGASFQVQSRTGGRGELFPWEGGWKDTVLLLDGETVEVLIKFTAFTGRYLMHCHKLEHEDMGMMTNFEVV
jgi:blue copper oxidase